MKTSVMTRSKGQVYSVGNYLMTGKVLGKGHFARVEEATHRIIGKKVAIKIIDLTLIKEEYARRNLHREPTVMARLRHPCIAALYETMMHGPRLYVVMEAAGGGDLCTLVLGARGVTGGMRGLPEARARGLAAQLVSAVRHMHARGVVHRDLKMENIMLDASKMFIKIVDFGLSNVWSSGGGLHTPCGSLEYAAPELFRESRRYGPELDLWSIGVIVYGMVTGGLPFVGSSSGGGGTTAGAGAEGEGRSRPQLRAAIARGFSRRHRATLVAFSPECKNFIQYLLEPNVETRMKIDEAAKHPWLRKPGMRMRTHPFGDVEPKTNREIFKQISDLCGTGLADIVSQVKSDPYGSVAGMYNIKTHLTQLNTLPSTDPLWSTSQETRPVSPPEYRPYKPTVQPLKSYESKIDKIDTKPTPPPHMMRLSKPYKPYENGDCMTSYRPSTTPVERSTGLTVDRSRVGALKVDKQENSRPVQSYNRMIRPLRTKPVYKVCDNGDGIKSRLPSIAEHRKLDADARWPRNRESVNKPIQAEERRKLYTCPARMDKRAEFYRKTGDGLSRYLQISYSWLSTGTGATAPSPARLLLQSNATTIKRASLGNITSPHSSINSHCKSERAMPVGWYSTRSTNKETTTLQRLRRTAPIK